MTHATRYQTATARRYRGYWIERKIETRAVGLWMQGAPLSVIARVLTLKLDLAGKVMNDLLRYPGQLMSERNGEVYFIEMQTPTGEKPIKIGYATWPELRLAGLQQSSPYPLVLLGSYRAGRAEEARLLQELALECIRGEWFHSSPVVWAKINKQLRR